MLQIFIIVIIIHLVYTLCHKTQIYIQSVGMFVHSSTTQKYSHQFTDSTGNTQFMHYHKTLIILFSKKSLSVSSCLYFTVHMDQKGTDLGVYPQNFVDSIFIVAYGILGSTNNINAN